MGNTWPADGNNIDNPNNTVVMKIYTGITKTSIRLIPNIDLDWQYGFAVFITWLVWYVEIEFKTAQHRSR